MLQRPSLPLAHGARSEVYTEQLHIHVLHPDVATSLPSPRSWSA